MNMERRIRACTSRLVLSVALGGSACRDTAHDDAGTNPASTSDADPQGSSDEGDANDAETGSETSATWSSNTSDPATGTTTDAPTACAGTCRATCLTDEVEVVGSCPGAQPCCEATPDVPDTDSGGTSDPSDGTDIDDDMDPGRPRYAYAALQENTATDCAVPALPDAGALPQIPGLPDPFTKLDGTRLTKRSEWHCRRQELHEQAEKYIYGEKPPRPDVVTGTVSSTEVTVHVEYGGQAIDYRADIVLPQGEGPFPAILNLGARGGFGGITLGESFVLEQGVAVIYYDHYDLGVEGTPEASRGMPNPGRFYDLYGGTHSAGLLMSWAWGASRLIDVLQEHGRDIIDTEGLGVTKCSRNGKGAFTVGVFDERIALTIPVETSTGGVPAYRIVDALSTERTFDNYYGLNWLSNDFEPFVLNAGALPVDTHEMVAMIAPRGLLVLDNPHIRQFGAPAGHTAALGGAEVYRALGVEGHLGYVSTVVNEQHCASGKPEYTEPLVRAIAKFLKRETNEPLVIAAHPNGTGNLEEWRDWTTPTLEDDLTGWVLE